MPVHDRLFVVVVETNGERDPETMALLNRLDGGVRQAPAFSSMHLATTFLARAQELGFYVKLDYIFPVDGRTLVRDFPGYAFRIDPSPEAFFTENNA